MILKFISRIAYVLSNTMSNYIIFSMDSKRPDQTEQELNTKSYKNFERKFTVSQKTFPTFSTVT